jgi:FtsH-binding integral membrane protein
MDASQSPLVQKFFGMVVDPLVQLLFAAAIVYFVYGVFAYFIKGDGDADRIQGKSHILWSTIGLLIMISVWGIIAVISRTLGVTG